MTFHRAHSHCFSTCIKSILTHFESTLITANYNCEQFNYTTLAFIKQQLRIQHALITN